MSKAIVQDGIHAMVPRDKMTDGARKLRDAYARVPGAPLYRREFGYYCLDRWKSEGHVAGRRPRRALRLRPARQPRPRPARLVRGGLRPRLRGQGHRGPRRARGRAGLRRPARALLQGPAQRLHARVPRPPRQGHGDLGARTSSGGSTRPRPSATPTSTRAWPSREGRRRRGADDQPERSSAATCTCAA